MKKLGYLICALFLFQCTSAQKKSKGGNSISKRYPEKSGNMMFSKMHFWLPGMLDNQSVSDTIFFYNPSAKTINLSVSPVQDFLTVKLSTDKLLPKKKGWMSLKYTAAARKSYGIVIDNFFLESSDSLAPRREINVSCIIEPYFPPMTAEEKANAPKIKMDATEFNFGDVKEGTIATHTFKVTNSGNSDLKILSIWPECGCISVLISKNVLAKGETALLHVSYNSTRKQGGLDQHGIVMYCNDPGSSKLNIGLKVNVVPQ